MAVGGGLIFRQQGEEYKCSSNNAIQIKLVKNEQDVLNPDITFNPEMSHQVFGDSETIFGYKNLEVQLYYHSGSLLTYLGMTYDSKVPSSAGIEIDAVLPNIAENLAPGYCTNLDEFVAKLPEESNFTPFGTKLHSYKRQSIEYEVYQADLSVSRLKDYHARLQPFILWYIDAASFLDIDDEKWNFFFVFEKSKGPSGNPEYSIVGYMTVYHYYAYPANIRPRISQMLILPPYLKKGHGAELLEAADRYYIGNPDVVDITVEDPSEDFCRLRDYVDCKNCLTLPAFQTETLQSGFKEDMVAQAKNSFKICKQQARHVYEILRLRTTNTADPNNYRDYRLDVKKRLNIPFQKQARDLQKLQSTLTAEEFNAAMIGNSREDRMQKLEESYRILEEDYRRVINRLTPF